MNLEVKFPIILYTKEIGLAYIETLEQFEKGCDWKNHTRQGYCLIDSDLNHYVITNEEFLHYIGSIPKFLVPKDRRIYKTQVTVKYLESLTLKIAKEVLPLDLRKECAGQRDNYLHEFMNINTVKGYFYWLKDY